MKITFTDTSAFVLTGRNSDNSKFYIRPKADIIRENEGRKISNDFIVISTMNEGVKEENKIIGMINNGVNFYTMYEEEFTEVNIVDGNLKSVSNDSTIDNIVNLPIMIKD